MDGADFAQFLEISRRLHSRYRVAIHAYCLMRNHYHLLLQTPRGKLQRYMQELNSHYSQYFNRRYRRVGPLFQGRYKALLVDSDSYALAISRYIHLNPVNAGLVRKPENYRWSSFATYVGARAADTYLHMDFILEKLNVTPARRRSELRRYTMAGIGDSFDPFVAARGGVVAGGDAFMKKIGKNLVPRRRDGTVSRLREIQRPPELKAMKESMIRRVNSLTKDAKLRKKMLIYGIRQSTTLTLREVASLVAARSWLAVGQTLSRLDHDRKKDVELDALMRQLEKVCRGADESAVRR